MELRSFGDSTSSRVEDKLKTNSLKLKNESIQFKTIKLIESHKFYFIITIPYFNNIIEN